MPHPETNANHELEHRLAIEKLLTQLSTRFLHTELDNFDITVDKTLEKLGTYAKADRCYLFILHENGEKMDNTHEWCAPDIVPQIENLKGLEVNAYPYIMNLLKERRPFHAPDVSALPSDAQYEKEQLQLQDIQSLVVVPMSDETKLIGFLGFDLCRKMQAWPQEDIELLQTMADIISNAFLRKQNEEALKLSERNYREIFNAANDAIFVFHISDGVVLDANERTLELLGYDYEEIRSLNVHDISFGKPPYSKKEAIQWTRKALKNGPQLYEWLIKRKDGELCWVEVHLKLATIQSEKRIIAVLRDITERKEIETERINLVNELKAALKKVKTLNGLLPICSKCKKIRDDNGYWNQIESYIRDHSRADFSHGLCPDCANEMYPNINIE